MVAHVVLWKLKEGFSDEEKTEICKKIKEGLEGLDGTMEGLLKIQVNYGPLRGSSADLCLYSEFEDEEALNGYQKHPAHMKVAGYVRSVAGNRMCLDYNA